MDEVIYKIMTRAELAEAKSRGLFDGSADDRRDGFIHLSSADQLESTLTKHFSGQEHLVLLAVEATSLGKHLRWEPSRDGALFPHLYGPLDLTALLWEAPLALGADGRHLIPQRVLP